MTEEVPARSVTPRGFTIYDEFTDDYGHQVRIQKSSNASRDCAWIFCQGGGDDENPSPHLTVEHATRVRDALDVFIREHGGDMPRTVTYGLSGPGALFVLTEALGRFESYQADRARDDNEEERRRWAALAARMREQAEKAFSCGTEG